MKFQTHKTIATRLMLILILVCGLTAINSTAQTSRIDSVKNSAPTQAAVNGANSTSVTIGDCDEDLRVANQRLAKTLDALEKAESLIQSLQAENVKRKELNDLNNSIIEKKDSVIAGQQKLIETYEKQKGTELSFFFGLIKFRKR